MLNKLFKIKANVWITVLVILLLVWFVVSLIIINGQINPLSSSAQLKSPKECTTDEQCGPQGPVTRWRERGETDGGIQVIEGSESYGDSGVGGPDSGYGDYGDYADGAAAKTSNSTTTTTQCVPSTKTPICADKTTLTKTQTTTLRWSCPSGNTKSKVVNSSGTTVSTSLKSTMTVGPFSNTTSGTTKTYKIYCYTTTQGNPDGQVGIRVN